MVSLKLFDFPLAYHPAKPRLALIEKRLPYQSQNVNILNGESLSPWYLKVNPKSTAPVLVADGKTLTESKDIVEYIDNIGTPLGGDSVDRPAVKRWVDQISEWDGNLYVFAGGPESTRSFLNDITQYKIKYAEARKKQHPDLASLYDEKIAGMKSSMVIDPAAVEKNDKVLDGILKSADSTLATQEYLAGGAYSLADVMFTVVLWRINSVSGKKAELIDPLPSVLKYYKAVEARPSFQKAFSGAGGLGLLRTVVPSLLKVKLAGLTGCY